MNNAVGIIVLAISVYILACIFIWRLLFIPKSGKILKSSKRRASHLAQTYNQLYTQKKLAEKIKFANLFRKMPVIGMSKEEYGEVERLIASTDARDKSGTLLIPEDIFLKQLTYVGILVLAMLLLAMISPLALLGILLVPIIKKIPLKDLKGKNEAVSAELTAYFYDFYKLYYSQFIDITISPTLASVVTTFTSTAPPLIQIAFGIFEQDIEKGEIYALQHFSDRYPDNAYIHKFCSIAKARITGDESVIETMKTYMQELEDKQDYYLNNELKARENYLSRLISVYTMIASGVLLVISMALMFTV